MLDAAKTKQQLLAELSELRERVSQLEREKTETTLVENEEKYRRLFENELFAICIFDLKTLRFIDVNDAHVRLYGYSREELMNSMIAPDLSAERETSIESIRRIESAGTLHIPLRYHRKKDGTVFPVEIVGGPYLLQGRPVMFAMVKDITGRMKAETALVESREKFSGVFENELIAIYIFDAQTLSIIDVNDTFLKLYGYSREEALAGMTIHDITVEHEASKEAVERAKKTGRYSIPLRYHRKKDGTVFPLEIVGGFYSLGGRGVMISMAKDISGRVEIEEALRRSEEKYRHIIEYSTEGIFQTTPDGRLVSANPALAGMFGFESPRQMMEEVHDVGEQLYACPRDRLKILEQMNSGERVFGLETTMRRRNGDTFRMSMNISSIRDGEGNLLHYNGFATDITDRKRAEEALIQAERKYRRLFAVESDALFLVEVDTMNILDVNLSAENLYGYGRDELLNMRSPDVSAEREETSRAIKNETSHTSIRWHRKKDGTVFPVEIAGTYFDLDGKHVHLAAVRDITELRRVEMELRRQSAMMGSLLDSIPDLIFYKDLNGAYLGCNPPAAEFFGRPRDEIVGKTDHDLFDGEVADFFREQDNRMLELSAPRQNEEWIKYPDGREILVDTLKTPLRGPDGTLIGILGISRDITERKRMEQQQQQLLKAESLTRMAGAIAHHFNNQLAVVIGGLEMALGDLGPDHIITPELTESREAALKAADVSTRMLAYLGQATARLTPLDLIESCRRVFRHQTASLPPPIDMEISMPFERLDIQGNASKVEQVLSNLIANAKEAIGEGKGSIRVSVRVVPAGETASPHVFPAGWQPENDHYACMEVSDTGCGIAPEQLDSIFDPFYSTRFTGRGLGLAVVQGILRMHRGAVSVESVPGRGSVFRVFWPLAAIEAASVPEQKPAVSQPGEISGCVLIVDDEPAIRNLAAKMLGRLGRQVLTAADGREAVEILRERENEIRLVLLDLTMPGITGWETLAGLRALRPDIAVVLASGYDEAQAMEGQHTELPQAFLHKPYSMLELQKAIGRALTASVRH